MFKERWESLATRDRRILLFGGIAVALLLAYVYLWMPVSQAASQEYRALERGSRLVVWMQHAMHRLQAYQRLGYQMPRQTNVASLSIVQQVFKAQRIDYHVVTNKQIDKQHVGVHISQVPFDRLITALNILADQYGIVVQSTRIKRENTDGLVEVRMILQR